MNTAAHTKKISQPRPSPGRFIATLLGELLLTAGIILLLFVAWQLWWTNLAADKTQANAVSSLAQEFHQAVPQDNAGSTTAGEAAEPKNDTQQGQDGATTTAVSAGQPQWVAGESTENLPVGKNADYGQAYGIIYIPRFGDTFQRPIAEGTGTDVLDTLGLGHYQNAGAPGALGNFALAGHRQTNGRVLDLVEELQTGDHIYVQTIDGYYTYTVYDTKIVLPTQVDVIDPNPAQPGAEPTQRLLTLTTCHPRYGDAERYIVHARLDAWQPLSAGPPAEILPAVQAQI